MNDMDLLNRTYETVVIKPFTPVRDLPPILCMSRATFYRRVQEGTLPEPTRIGGFGKTRGYDADTLNKILRGIPHAQ